MRCPPSTTCCTAIAAAPGAERRSRSWQERRAGAGERRLAESGSGLGDSGDGPSHATVATLFAHAERALGEMPERLAGLSYVSPDRVAQGDVLADLLLVDEAAAIPTPLLEAMLARHSRIVFATTEHGYEGRGAAFICASRRYSMSKPRLAGAAPGGAIRWSLSDPLEPLIFRLLGLNTDISAPHPRHHRPGAWSDKMSWPVMTRCSIGCSACSYWLTTRPAPVICGICWRGRISTFI